MTPLLTLKNLSLTFPGRTAPALERASTSSSGAGETLCLLGAFGLRQEPQLLRLVAGLEAPERRRDGVV